MLFVKEKRTGKLFIYTGMYRKYKNFSKEYKVLEEFHFNVSIGFNFNTGVERTLQNHIIDINERIKKQNDRIEALLKAKELLLKFEKKYVQYPIPHKKKPNGKSGEKVDKCNAQLSPQS